MEPATAIETPSGKDEKYENFLVGSPLLPARVRRHVAKFYAFARAIDDIADNPYLQPNEKIARLEGFSRSVRGIDTTDPLFRKGHRMRESLAETGVVDQHCVDLIRAFKQDATKLRYDSWEDLLEYCDFSAAPVGRYLIDLHEESSAAYPAADALCNALQVINHLQDCGDDFRELNRVYLPQDWMTEAGANVGMLSGSQLTSSLRRVLDRCLDKTDELLVLANPLPEQIRDLRFAMETAAIVVIARRLSHELRRRDPLAERVVLTKVQFGLCCLKGVCQAVLLALAR